jgi:hypothetical protein
MFGKGVYQHVGGPHGELVKINVPVTLPSLEFLTKGPPPDDEPERREVAARFAEHRTVRAGLECWQAIGRAESFEAWVKIGKALQIGRDYALKTTGANRPMGQIYCRTFSAWIDQHGFERMPAATRSVAVELARTRQFRGYPRCPAQWTRLNMLA